ncbi:hypothetical protein GCK32_003841 [Trichostrongylus colubriformis]
MCEASCVRQLDVEILQTQSSTVDPEYVDSKIERALRELTESRNLLGASELSLETNGIADNTTSLQLNNTAKQLINNANRSSNYIKRSAIQFPSMSRPRN